MLGKRGVTETFVPDEVSISLCFSRVPFMSFTRSKGNVARTRSFDCAMFFLRPLTTVYILALYFHLIWTISGLLKEEFPLSFFAGVIFFLALLLENAFIPSPQICLFLLFLLNLLYSFPLII